jgi:hypothetical protein
MTTMVVVISLPGGLVWKPGPVLLIVGDGADRVASLIAERAGSSVVSVGSRAAHALAHGGNIDPAKLLEDGSVFADLDVLFWEPGLHADVAAILSRAARSRPVAVIWPGAVTGGVVSYSEPGRKDFYEKRLDDVIVLRPKVDSYPDEPPYTMELVGQ